MDQNLNMFRNIMEGLNSDTYTYAWEEYPDIDFRVALEKVMNTYVHNTYSTALRLLSTTKGGLSWVKSHHWISKLLKMYESCTESRIAHQIFTVIGVLAKLANESRESRRLFGTHHITNILNVIFKECSVPIDNYIALQCISILLEFYPEYCTSSEDAVRGFLSNLVDSQKLDIVEYCAKCYHLLLNTYKYRENMEKKGLWYDYQEKLIEDLQKLLNKLLARSPSMVFEAVECGPLNIPALLLSDDPIIRLPRIFVRWRNFAIYLIVTLREPLSVGKLINPNKILNLIKNSLEALSTISEKNKINHIILTLLLPQLYFILLQVLEALITTLERNLRRNYKEVWAIFLNISSAIKSMEGKQSYILLRIKLCDIIGLWCKITGQGSRSDLAHSFIMNAVFDMSSIYIFPKSTYTKPGLKGKLADKCIQEVTNATHRCLYEILSSSPTYVKSQDAKTIEATTFNIYAAMRNTELGNNINNGSVHDLTQVLFAMLTTKNFLSPSCSETLINIARERYLKDPRNQTHHIEAIMLLFLENCIHPQKDSLKCQREFTKSFDDNRKLPQSICTFDERSTERSNEKAVKLGYTLNIQEAVKSSLASRKTQNSYSEDVNQPNLNDNQLISNIITAFVDDLS